MHFFLLCVLQKDLLNRRNVLSVHRSVCQSGQPLDLWVIQEE